MRYSTKTKTCANPTLLLRICAIKIIFVAHNRCWR